MLPPFIGYTHIYAYIEQYSIRRLQNSNIKYVIQKKIVKKF